MLANGNELIYIGDLEDAGDTKRIRGAMASLVKKGAIDVNHRDGGLITLFV
jgi:hypothetical protein